MNYHIGGQLKIAPEHISKLYIALYGKPQKEIFNAFCDKYQTMNKKAEKTIFSTLFNVYTYILEYDKGCHQFGRILA